MLPPGSAPLVFAPRGVIYELGGGHLNQSDNFAKTDWLVLDRGAPMNVSSRSRHLAAPALLLATLVVAFTRGVAPADAHEHTIPWLDESVLDGGLYVELRHPRVIRKAGPF